jgi:competence protein ComEC
VSARTTDAGRRIDRTAVAISPARDGLRHLQSLAAGHPRHVLLTAIVTGLLAGPRSPAALAAGAFVVLLAHDALLAIGALVALLAGAWAADARLTALDRTALKPLLGHEVSVRATLLEHPRTRTFGVRVAALALRTGPGRGERVVLRAAAHVPLPAGAEPGAELAVKGRLKTLTSFEEHERRRNAHALLQAETVRATGRRRAGLLGALDAVCSRTERALTSGVPPPQGALARGMVLGQDGALTDDVREDFRVTGLAHLVAASGSNVLLLATLVLAIGTAAGLGLSARLWLAVALVVAYVPLAGAGPSIQRAGVMGVAGLVAALAGRPSSRWYALLLAAALTLAQNPRAAEDPGWQLSFAAVLAMLALVPPLCARLRRRNVPRGLAEALAVTLAATLGTAPLIALHFERLSLVSLPVNLLAAPAVAPIMWLGTIGGAIAQVAPALATPFAQLAALPLAYLTWLADRGAALPHAELELGSPGPIGVVVVYAAAAAGLMAWRRLGARRDSGAGEGARRVSARARRIIGCACLALLAAGVAAGALASRPPAPPRDLTVSFLDIGQGDATLIQHGDAAVLVDTGPPEGPILKRLREAGVRRLDLLVVTHAALDHDGSAAAVMDEIPIEMVLDGEEVTPATAAAATSGAGPQPSGSAAAGAAASAAPVGPFGARAAVPVALLAARHRIHHERSDAGQVIRVGPIELRVLWPRREPPAPPAAEPNDRATVLHVRDGDFDLLLSADAESNALGSIDLPDVDAMKVPHHGSDDPGLPELLRRLSPHVAVVEVGRHNLYGHPTPATLRALDAAVPVVRRTDRDGTVRLRVKSGAMTLLGPP